MENSKCYYRLGKRGLDSLFKEARILKVCGLLKKKTYQECKVQGLALQQ